MRNNKGQYINQGFNNYTIDGDIVKIHLKNGYDCIIDLDCLEKINNYRWHTVIKENDNIYVTTTIKNNNKSTSLQLSRLLLNITDPKIYIDHIDRNCLNNRLSNLRICNNNENQQNTSYSKNSKLKIRGISICKTTGQYKCQLTKNRKFIYNKRFTSLDEAERNMMYQRQLHCTHLNKEHKYIFNLMSYIPHSKVNGPGDRFTFWLQGCHFACPMCINPESWDFKINKLIYVDELIDMILKSKCDGLTISGGEPLRQREALLDLLIKLEPYVLQGILKYGIICYSGFEIEEVEKFERSEELLGLLDVLIDGKFVENLKTVDSIAGSSNQRFHFSKKEDRGNCIITLSDIEEIDKGVEIHSSSLEKTVQITGFPNIDRRFLKSIGLTVK